MLKCHQLDALPPPRSCSDLSYETIMPKGSSNKELANNKGLMLSVYIAVSVVAVVSLSSCSTVRDAENVGAQSNPFEFKTSTEHLLEGNNYFKKGDYAKAEISYRKALAKDPKNPTAKNNLGVILNELGKPDEAIPILQEAIKTDNKNAIAHYVLGKALNSKQRFDEAYTEAKIATELDPTDPIGWRTLGEAALGRAEVDTAISAFKQAITIDDTHDVSHHRLAQALAIKGDVEGQIEEERNALDLNPNNIDARLSLAIALTNQGKRDDAIAELKEVLEIDPKNNAAQNLYKELKISTQPSKTN